MKLKYFLFSFLLVALLSIPPLYAADYTVDAGHSSVGFKVRHLLSWVKGTFNQFEGHFSYEPGKPETWKAEMTVQADSIDTNMVPRDKHLRSKDFFDVENFSVLTFKSTSVSDVTDTSAKLHGVLTIHGVEREVVFDLDIYGVATDPWGNTKSAFSATTKINRSDYGLSWNEALETGGVLVGEEVEIALEIEGNLLEGETV